MSPGQQKKVELAGSFVVPAEPAPVGRAAQLSRYRCARSDRGCGAARCPNPCIRGTRCGIRGPRCYAGSGTETAVVCRSGRTGLTRTYRPRYVTCNKSRCRNHNHGGRSPFSRVPGPGTQPPRTHAGRGLAANSGLGARHALGQVSCGSPPPVHRGCRIAPLPTSTRPSSMPFRTTMRNETRRDPDCLRQWLCG